MALPPLFRYYEYPMPTEKVLAYYNEHTILNYRDDCIVHREDYEGKMDDGYNTIN